LYFLKTIQSEEVHHRNFCKAENDDVRRKHRSVLSIEINRTLQECFKSTYIYLA